MSALNAFLAKGRKKKKGRKGRKPVKEQAPAPAAAAPVPVVRVVKKPTSGWVEKTYQQTILKDKKVADLSELTYSDDEPSEDEDEVAEKAQAKAALARTMRRARRKAEKAAAQDTDPQAQTEDQPAEPEKKNAYVPWRLRQARADAAKKAGKPPKIDDESAFPSLGGAPAAAAPAAAAPAPASAWGVVPEMEGLDEESDSDDEPPPPLEPVGAHLRRQAKEEVAKEPEVDEMEDEVFNAKVENMISNFQDTHRHTDITEPMEDIQDRVSMKRRKRIAIQAIVMGIWGTQKDREAVNLLLPKMLEAGVMDRPTLREGVTNFFETEMADHQQDEPMTPLFVSQMIKKLNFRSVIPDSALPKSVADALAGNFKPVDPRDTAAAPEPEPAAPPAAVPAPAPAAAETSTATAAPPAARAAPEPAAVTATAPAAVAAAAAASTEEDPNADLFKKVKKKKKKKKKFVPSA